MVEKGKRYETRAVDFSHRGEAVVKIDGFTVFVPGLLPGEKALVRIVEKKKHFGRALLVERLTQSPHRREPPCPIYERCGGCQLQHVDDKQQLEMKKNKVVQALDRIGGVDVSTVKNPWGMLYPWRYRTKAQFQFNGGRLGYFSRGTHKFVPVDDCLLLPSDMNECRKNVEKLLKKEEVKPEKAVLKKSIKLGKFQAVFYGPRLGHHHLRVLGNKMSVIPGLVSSGWVDIKTQHYYHMHGPDYLDEDILGLSFRISPQSFVQVNHQQMENLYSYVIRMLDVKPGERILDLYCGIGALTCHLAKNADRAAGIDSVHSAIIDARLNAQINRLDNLLFHTGKAEKVFIDLLEKGETFDTIVLDPPRSGASPPVLENVIKANPGKIGYISCNPATLARDLKRLCAAGYNIKLVKPIDLFPQTAHVECVVLMSRAEK